MNASEPGALQESGQAPPIAADPPLPATRAQQVARAGLTILLGLLALWTLRDFLPALAWALVLAIATWPLYRRACAAWPASRHKVWLPGLFTLAIVLGVLVPLVLLAVQVGREAGAVAQWLETVRQGGIAEPGWLTGLPFGERLAAWWHDTLSQPGALETLLRRLDRARIVSVGREVGADVLHRATLFGFTVLTLFFLYRDGEALAAQGLRACGRLFGPRGEKVLRQMVASVHGTVDGLVLVGLGEGVVMGIAYAVAGVPHPTLLGALTAIAAMIPFATPLVFAVASALLLAQGATAAAAAVFGLGMAVLFVADHLVRPVLIGGATRLPFLLVLLGILGGLQSWGLLGLFLGPAIMAAVVLLWREGTAAGPAAGWPRRG